MNDFDEKYIKHCVPEEDAIHVLYRCICNTNAILKYILTNITTSRRMSPALRGGVDVLMSSKIGKKFNRLFS